MNHAITISGLIASVAIVCGLALGLIGIIVWFAGGMSDAPDEGGQAAKAGCIIFMIGAVMIALSIWAIV